MSTAAPKRSSELDGRSVLVVEDEALLALILVDELDSRGAIPIGPFATVAEGLASAQSAVIHAAMINVNLRGEKSFAIADKLIDRGIPFLFVTGNDELARQQYPAIPAHPKPYEVPRILDALELLLREAASG